MPVNTLFQDVRYALRLLRKSPGFTAVAILTLALGIGATTAIFTVVNRVLLEPLEAYPHPHRMVVLVHRSGPNSDPAISIPEYLMWRSQTRILEDPAASPWNSAPANLLGGDRPQQLQAQRVTANYFALLGFRVALGRTFTAQEDVPGGPPVAVITDAL